MQTAKIKTRRRLLNNLPDDNTLDDIQYHLYVLEKIRRGQDDIRNGRHYTQEEAKERLQRKSRV